MADGRSPLLDLVRQSLYATSCPQVTVEGLEIMNDDPSEVDVLYAKVILPVLFKFFPFLGDFCTVCV
jgi:hypothetical protein